MKNKVILATAATQNYIPKITPYLRSINQNSNFDHNIFITLDCEWKDNNFNNITIEKLSNELIITKNSNNCLQHGEFLKCEIFEKFKDDDYICFTDGDIIMQRSLNLNEFLVISNLKDNEIIVQYNAGNTDNLLAESKRLKPKIHIEEWFRKFPCYNTGVLLCNIRTWKKLENIYRIIHPISRNIFNHYASQQWTLSYIINIFMKPIILDYSFHIHHHHGLIENTFYKNNQIYFNNNLCLFAHHIQGIS